ncbi:MAG TPA: HlyD family secretion protein [Dongiaceae bacterium]|nr:HlyD family secretion protein [Dongiaceae bacterium]
MPDGSKAITETAAETPEPQPNRRRRLRRLLMIGGPLAVLIGVGVVYLTGGRYAGTDNAYVHTHMVSVSADISGRVVDLEVHENEPVKTGDVLFHLDPEPLQIAVDQARANLETARNKVIGLKAAYRTRQEDLKAAEANVGFAQRELKRREKLVAGKIISQSDYDEARNRYNVAVNEAASIGQDISRIISELGGDPDIDPEQHPTYLAAEAALAQAELDMRHGTVTAPADGVVAQVDTLRPGDYIKAGEPVFNIVSQKDAWIEANLKETDLTYVKPGQQAEVTIDTYPGRTFTAVVDSIGMATGAEFSVLPAQNASGNWVKVVQRIPVRLHVVDLPENTVLRAGMSAVVEIDTKHRRGLFTALARIFTWDQAAQAKAQ